VSERKQKPRQTRKNARNRNHGERRRQLFGGHGSGRAQAQEAGGLQGHETILLVEDEPAVRQLFATALIRAGYRVYEARNGQEALQVFDQHGDSIDLLLTDMRMPYMGGAELAQHLRARRRTLKLLCVSGYPNVSDTALTSDFLAKPFSRDDLLAKVREVLDRK
jgi:two-component system, cell cycle sensor histidine kinase and response regulator CckA